MGLVTCGKKVRGVHDQGVVLRQSKPGEPYYWLDSKVIRAGRYPAGGSPKPFSALL